MKPKNVILIAVGLIAAVIVAWNLFKPAGGTGISNVDAAGAEAAISQGAQVVDVRSEGEYQLGHIPGAINVPIDRFEGQIASWDKNRLYLIYCATGARSATAVEAMKGLGFTNVRHFAAGLQAWPGELAKGDSSSAAQTIPTSGKPVFLEFYTDSWPTCAEMKPVVDRLREKYGETVEFRVLNVETDANANAQASSLGVTGVPTFFFVNSDGVQAGQVIGAATEEQLAAAIEGLK